MNAAHFIVDNTFVLLLFAIILGVMIDFFCSFYEGMVATVALPAILIIVSLVCSTVESKEKKAAAIAAQQEQLKNCVKFAERDAQSIWQYPQIGYRCPATDGQPAIERWINQ